MVKISFIIPVYNVEKYLRRAFLSLQNQTMTDFEAIFINDGSPDNSGVLLAEFEKADSRVKVITKENGGVASARNAGLDAAKGEYILFLDPDDWFEANAAEELYSRAKSEDADLVIFGSINDFYDDEGRKVYSQRNHPKPLGVFKDEPFKKYFDKLAASYLITSKMYRRSLIEENHCRFENKNVGEDGLFYISVYSQNPKCLVVTDEAYYHYTSGRSTSLSNSFHEDRLRDNFYLSKATARTVKSWGLENSELHARTVKYCIIRDLQYGIKNASLSDLSFGERCVWLKKVMSDNEVREAVKAVPLSVIGGRNDVIKLLLLKLHMYRTVVFISKLNQKG